MKRTKRVELTAGLGIAALSVAAGPALAVDVNIQGFIRQEIALKATDDENPFNQQGNIFNGQTVSLDSTAIGGFVSNATRNVDAGDADNTFNLFATRLEIDVQANFSSNWTAFMKVRGYGDWGIYEDFEDPSFFETPFFGSNGTRLEYADRQFMIDVPALYVDYNDGPLWVRVGNQQIAWGESLFFRVLDVPNGLDLRRHLILDFASEEYSDKRVPAPGVRGSYRFTDEVQLELFSQAFNPSILPTANSPYNLIPAQFTVHQEEQFDAVEDDWTAGGRLQGQFGDLGVQALIVSRRNPDGVFRWTESGVNRDIPGLVGSGAVLQNTPFEVNPTGVLSAQEWFTYASMVRLNGATAVDAAVNDFQPWTGLLGAFPPGGDFALAGAELDLFFQLSGGLRGHIERVYPWETIYGVGANYIFSDEPGSVFDQLVMRFEATFTPDKTFTAPDLSAGFLVEDEWSGSLVFEKYYRFSQDFPATFLVLQWLHKTESDLFGRHLSGNGATAASLPTGNDNFDAVVFAFQQPFPNLVWRADFSVLYDVKGGALIQPAVRWKPNEQWTVEAFANILVSDGENDNIIETLDFADEVSIRVSYQF